MITEKQLRDALSGGACTANNTLIEFCAGKFKAAGLITSPCDPDPLESVIRRIDLMERDFMEKAAEDFRIILKKELDKQSCKPADNPLLIDRNINLSERISVGYYAIPTVELTGHQAAIDEFAREVYRQSEAAKESLTGAFVFNLPHLSFVLDNSLAKARKAGLTKVGA